MSILTIPTPNKNKHIQVDQTENAASIFIKWDKSKMKGTVLRPKFKMLRQFM